MSIDLAHNSEISVGAISLGPESVALRSQGGGGRVIAVLSNAIYLRSEDGLVLGVIEGEIDSPLSVRVSTLAPLIRAAKESTCNTFEVTSDTVIIADCVSIAWGNVQSWSPRLPAKVGSHSERLAVVTQLTRHIANEGLREGCASAACYLVERWNGIATQPSPADPLAARFLRRLNVAHAALQKGDTKEAVASVMRLLGLGPGLTPSGDDFLAGLVTALVWQSRLDTACSELADKLVAAIRETAPSRTNHISARMLWHACDGLLYAPAMELEAALFSGDSSVATTALPGLLSIGHTTGGDIAAGLMVGVLLDDRREMVD